MNSTDVTAAPKKRAWFQVRLSSLLFAQMIASLLVYLNFQPMPWFDQYGAGPDLYLGFPFRSLRGGYFFYDALTANILLGFSVAALTVAILEIFHRRKTMRIKSVMQSIAFHLPTRLWLITCFLIELYLFSFKIREGWMSFGWPYIFDAYIFGENGLCYNVGWGHRYLVLDFYIALAWIVPTTLLLEWYLRRRDRLKVIGAL